MTIELYKDIPGYEGKYQVSDRGRVRSLDRSWMQKSRHGTTYRHFKKGVTLKPGLATHGYRTVMLGRDGGSYCVHALVALAWIGPRPKGLDVCHRNARKNDCKVSNLYYGSRSENNYDGAKNDILKVSRKTVALIRKSSGTHQAVADKFGVSMSYVCQVRQGTLRKHG